MFRSLYFLCFFLITIFSGRAIGGTINDVYFNVINRNLQDGFYYGKNNSALWNICQPDQNVSVAIHGWKENINSFYGWTLINNLLELRGGCVIFVEYSNYSTSYAFLTNNKTYNQISQVIVEQLLNLTEKGFNLNSSIIVGFSYGSRQAFNIGLMLRVKGILLERIDAMDPAGPTFDSSTALRRNISNSARMVQCVHTSVDYGTKVRNTCTRNWIMGNCGRKQAAMKDIVGFRNHGLAMQFYNSAFNNDFVANKNNYTCTFVGIAVNYTLYPVIMGPRTDNDITIKGMLFADTNAKIPFNV
jgi:hypothetical protein